MMYPLPHAVQDATPAPLASPHLTQLAKAIELQAALSEHSDLKLITL